MQLGTGPETGNWGPEASICLESGSRDSPWGMNWHSDSELCLAVAAFVYSKMLCTSCRTGGPK